MKRLRVRASILTALWVSVGIILFAAIRALVLGQLGAIGGVFGVGLLAFVVVGAVFANEVQAAIVSANHRVDDAIAARVRHNLLHDARLARIERMLNIPADPQAPPYWPAPASGSEAPR